MIFPLKLQLATSVLFDKFYRIIKYDYVYENDLNIYLLCKYNKQVCFEPVVL